MSGIILENVLNAFTNSFGKTTVGFITSVRPHESHTGRAVMKSSTWIFFWKSVEKIQVTLRCDKNNEYFVCKSMYIYLAVLGMRNISDKKFLRK